MKPLKIGPDDRRYKWIVAGSDPADDHLLLIHSFTPPARFHPRRFNILTILHFSSRIHTESEIQVCRDDMTVIRRTKTESAPVANPKMFAKNP